MKVYKEPCKNCLLSTERIVSAKVAKQIINNCKRNQSHFICHKATIEGKDICCHTFFTKLGYLSQLARIAMRLGFVKYVDQPDSEKLTSFKDMK